MSLTRRQLLVRGALVATAGAALSPRRLLARQHPPATPAPAPAAPPTFEARVTALRGEVATFTARGGTIAWWLAPAGLVVVDTQYAESARACLARLRERSPRPIDAVVNTHHHADHTGGNGVFRPETKLLVAQANVPGLQRRAAAEHQLGEQTFADTLFDERWRLDLGAEVVTARHYGAAHTGGDAVVHFERADVVHLGDLVFNRFHPRIDRPGGASIRGWISVLEQVAATHGDAPVYVFGHGRPEFGLTGGRADLLYQRDYFHALLEQARQGLAAGKSVDEIASAGSLPGFADHRAPSPSLSLAACLRAACEELSPT